MNRQNLILLVAIFATASALADPATCESDPKEPECPVPLTVYAYSSIECPSTASNKICALPLPPATLDCADLVDQGMVECIAGPIATPYTNVSYSWISSNPFVVPQGTGGHYQIFSCDRFRLTTITVVVSDAFGHSQSASFSVGCTKARTNNR